MKINLAGLCIHVGVRVAYRSRLARLICRLRGHLKDEDGDCTRCGWLQPLEPILCPACGRPEEPGDLLTSRLCACGHVWKPASLRDLFPTFRSPRGGIRFVTPPEVKP